MKERGGGREREREGKRKRAKERINERIFSIAAFARLISRALNSFSIDVTDVKIKIVITLPLAR
jgi:hypothetical protein